MRRIYAEDERIHVVVVVVVVTKAAVNQEVKGTMQSLDEKQPFVYIIKKQSKTEKLLMPGYKSVSLQIVNNLQLRVCRKCCPVLISIKSYGFPDEGGKGKK